MRAKKFKSHPVHAMKTYGRSAGLNAIFLNLSTRWRAMVTFTNRPLSGVSASVFQYDAGWIRRRSGRSEGQKSLLSLSGIEPWIVELAAVIILTTLSLL